MTEKIKIVKREDIGTWKFVRPDDPDVLNDILLYNYRACEICGLTLDTTFVYIIGELNKAGLLPKDFKYLCCTCAKLSGLCQECGKEKSVKYSRKLCFYIVECKNCKTLTSLIE